MMLAVAARTARPVGVLLRRCGPAVASVHTNPAARQGAVPGSATDASAQHPVNESFFEKNARLQRPISPHMAIYRPQLSWCLSGLHRATGTGLALGLSGAMTAAALSSGSSADLVTLLYSTVPVPLLFAVKAAGAGVFSFKLWTGLRHLVWDTSVLVTNSGVTATSYAVFALTAASSAYFLLAY